MLQYHPPGRLPVLELAGIDLKVLRQFRDRDRDWLPKPFLMAAIAEQVIERPALQ
jgi:hypothetical protein